MRCRVVAITRCDLRERLAAGSFRDDLYYRLCSDIVVVPPLRQRFREDSGELDLLVSHLVGRILGEDVDIIPNANDETSIIPATSR